MSKFLGAHFNDPVTSGFVGNILKLFVESKPANWRTTNPRETNFPPCDMNLGLSTRSEPKPRQSFPCKSAKRLGPQV